MPSPAVLAISRGCCDLKSDMRETNKVCFSAPRRTLTVAGKICKNLWLSTKFLQQTEVVISKKNNIYSAFYYNYNQQRTCWAVHDNSWLSSVSISTSSDINDRREVGGAEVVQIKGLCRNLEKNCKIVSTHVIR